MEWVIGHNDDQNKCDIIFSWNEDFHAQPYLWDCHVFMIHEFYSSQQGSQGVLLHGYQQYPVQVQIVVSQDKGRLDPVHGEMPKLLDQVIHLDQIIYPDQVILHY